MGKEDGLEYWMCPHGISAEDAIWKALAAAYSVKKDGLTHDEVIAAVRKATSS